jgi:uncharacterized protein YraI
MRNPRTGSRWQRVLGLALVLTLTLITPVSVSADAGTNGPGTPPASGNGSTQPTGTRLTYRAVNLRTSASTDSFAITIIPQGSTITLTGNLNGQFAEIKFGDASGWVEAEFLLEDTAGTETPVPTPVDSTSRTLSDDTNLRTAPDLESDIVAVLTAGETVNVTGDIDGEFAKVTSTNGIGWVAAQFLLETFPSTVTPPVTVASTATAVGTESPVSTPTPIGTQTPGPTDTPSVTPPANETPTQVVMETATVDVTATATVTVAPTQGPTEGITETPGPTVTVPVETITIVPTQTAPSQPTETPAMTPTSGADETPTAPAGNSLVVWPIKGGSWTISQGYNGSSHQNNNDLWQYLYSFDIVPTNGEAAGKSVYSPVNGTIRWFDPSTGGISIDMGGGLAFAMFHMDVDGGLQVGDQLKQGQFVGTIAAPGGGGNGGFPHLHITAWSTSDGGNFSRQAIPFTGSVAISGKEFPADGSSQQYTGVEFTP